MLHNETDENYEGVKVGVNVQIRDFREFLNNSFPV